VVDANRPRESGIQFVAASDDFARTHMTIRIRRGTDA
jgi:hypothetical protein